MQNLYKDLEKILLSIESFKSEDGKVLKNKVTELAVSNDKSLIVPLLKNPKLKKHFFDEIEKGVVAFDREKFIRFVNTKEFLPNSFTSFTNKIGLHDGTEYLNSGDKVSLVWPYKDCVLEGGQDKEDQKRSEIFYNETLAPDEIDRLFDKKVFTGIRMIDAKGERIPNDFSSTDGLFIKGNNLLSLHSIKGLYRNKIKLIYIDPPYNREDDQSTFYNDNFNHSTWLTFIKNRLEVAYELLSEDGSIFISIDDSEQAYLKVLCDSIFGRDNFLTNVAYERSGVSGLGQGGSFLVNTHESILCYAKNKKFFNSNELKGESPFGFAEMKRYNKILKSIDAGKEFDRFVSSSTGEDVVIRKHKDFEIDTISLKNYEKLQNEINDKYKENFEKVYRLTSVQAENEFQNKILEKCKDGVYSAEYLVSRGKNKGKVNTVYYVNGQILVWLKDSAAISEGTIVKTNKLSDFWTHASIPKADLANEGGVKLRRGKKPEALLHRIISMATNEGDYVLDFFSGSGTTCAVSLKMNRKFIGIEQIHYGENDSLIRLKNVIDGDKTGISKKVNWKGGGSFVCAELKRWNQEYFDEIEDATTNKKLLSIYEKMKKEAFFRYEIDLSKFDVKEFSKLELGDQKRILLDCLDKNHLYVNYNDINDTTYKVSPEDKKLNKLFYKE